MNLVGVIAVILSAWACVLTCSRLRSQTTMVRLAFFGTFSLLALPSLLFTIYYLHVLPEWDWYYTLRSWRGSELLVIFLGCAMGAFASFLPRMLLGFPLFALLFLAAIPYIKPVFGPLGDGDFQEHWRGNAFLQSTRSTCGPASVCTILKRLGAETSERAAARASFSYSGGTEAWYLARFVRSKGFTPRFDFRDTFFPSVGLPAMVGVRIGGCGHFIAVLELNGDQVTFADPLQGEYRLSLSEFQKRYSFTGLHMVITKAKSR